MTAEQEQAAKGLLLLEHADTEKALALRKSEAKRLGQSLKSVVNALENCNAPH